MSREVPAPLEAPPPSAPRGRFVIATPDPLAAALPGTLAIGIFLYWAARDGGYTTTIWAPTGILFVGLLAFVAARRSALSRPALVSLACLGAFALLNFASVAWAGDRGAAWNGANRALLYTLIFALFVLLPWKPASAAVALALFAVGATALVLVEFLRAAAAPADYESFFIAGRLATPISYSNADCALLLAAAWPAALLAARRELPPLVRGLLLAAAGVAAELALVCQSRASLLAVPLVALLVLAVSPGRLRLLLVAVPLVVVVAVSAHRLLDVYTAVVAGSPADALAAARTAVAASGAILFGVGFVLALADRRSTVPESVIRKTSIAVAALALFAAIVGIAGAAWYVGDPVSRARHAWASFKQDAKDGPGSFHLVGGIGSNRYDYWRVALLEFRDAPILGIGSDNFASKYLLHRRSKEEGLYPHSLEFRILAQNGLAGALLFTGFLATAAAAAARAIRADRWTAAVASAALASFAYWLLHGSVDWFWEIPALAGPALAFLAVAVRLGSTPAAAPRRARHVWIVRSAAAAALVLAVASLALPWLSDREVELAAVGWPADRAAAYSRLELARKLNPFASAPDLMRGVIAARTGDDATARNAFHDALERRPATWFAMLELAVVDARDHRSSDALAWLARAQALDPREPYLALADERLRKGLPLSQASMERYFADRAALLTGARQG